LTAVLGIIQNALKIPDLRKKIIITLLLLLVYRVGSFIPVPGLDAAELKRLAGSGGALGFLDIISGGAFQMATIFAMSITPYINASIIMQLLTVAIPKFEQMAKEGEEGRKKIGQLIRYATVVLGFLQATGLYFGLRAAILERGVLSYIVIALSFTAGTAFLMWLGEKITEHGVGNGISLIIFAGIISQAPAGATALWVSYDTGVLGEGIGAMLKVAGILATLLLVITAIVWVQQAERRIPIQYAKRVVGNKMYGGQKSHIPIKVNLAGVIPIIFAMSFVALPSTVISLFAPTSTNWLVVWFREAQSSYLYSAATAVLVMFFTFFYAYIQFNPIEISNNIKKSGGFIPGVRPGKPTSEYLMKVLNRVTWFSATFLALITIFPTIIAKITSLNGVWFAGTGALIMVGVALDTVKQMESHMLSRHYKGFLE
jgi:preprotein translocase subunit SecY